MNDIAYFNNSGFRVEPAQRRLATGSTLTLDASQFEQLKQATITYFVQSKPEHSEIFIAELQQGQSVINAESTWQHGAWRLEQRDGHLVLVRYPGRGGLMYFWVVFFAQQNQRWQVEALEIERMWERRH